MRYSLTVVKLISHSHSHWVRLGEDDNYNDKTEAHLLYRVNFYV